MTERDSLLGGVTIQACKHCGSGAPLDAHFCPKCEKILSLARHGDYFAFLGLPRKLAVDPTDLDRRLRTLSRQFHPDYYCNATPAERLASLERASYLNDAYRTLRDPTTRVEYLLEVEGVALKRGGTGNGASADLLEEVFELNEHLDAIRQRRLARTAERDALERAAEVESRTALDAARVRIDRRLADYSRRLDDLSRRWDALIDEGAPRDQRRPVLDALKTLLLERNYIANLLAAIEREAAAADTA